MFRGPVRLAVCMALSCALIFAVAGSAAAQISGGGDTGNGTGNGTNNGTAGNGAAAGVTVDADGLVKTIIVPGNKRLNKQRLAAIQKELTEDLTKFSPLRKVSLVRLEQACAEFAETQKHVTPDMQYLAGLQRIDYVFVFPESHDIVIAGPAEGFAEDGAGRTVGLTTGRPPLRLDDLMVALRAVNRGDDVGCSIDARPENLAKFKQYQASHSGAASAAVGKKRFAQMAKILGNQKVTIWGVPQDSHFARTMVEADYFMKKISIGQLQLRVRGFKTHLSMVGPGDDMANRWWFAPLYEPFQASDDGNAYKISGPRAQLFAENEIVTADGKRIGVGTKAASTDRYANHFTEKFPELAEAVPAFAELQTLFDLLTVSALIEKQGLAERIGWSMSLFLDDQRGTVAKWNVPRDVPTSVAYKRTRGRMLIGMVGGGVMIDPRRTLEAVAIEEGDESLIEKQTAAEEAELPAGRWWWD